MIYKTLRLVDESTLNDSQPRKNCKSETISIILIRFAINSQVQWVLPMEVHQALVITAVELFWTTHIHSTRHLVTITKELLHKVENSNLHLNLFLLSRVQVSMKSSTFKRYRKEFSVASGIPSTNQVKRRRHVELRLVSREFLRKLMVKITSVKAVRILARRVKLIKKEAK